MTREYKALKAIPPHTMPTTVQSTEIKQLLQKVQQKRAQFFEGIRTGKEFGELKPLFLEVKELEQRLRAACEKANTDSK